MNGCLGKRRTVDKYWIIVQNFLGLDQFLGKVFSILTSAER